MTPQEIEKEDAEVIALVDGIADEIEHNNPTNMVVLMALAVVLAETLANLQPSDRVKVLDAFNASVQSGLKSIDGRRGDLH